jgi:hypothetical protein
LNENRVVVVVVVVVVGRSLTHSSPRRRPSLLVSPVVGRADDRRSTLARSSGAYPNQNPVQTKPNRSTVVTTD